MEADKLTNTMTPAREIILERIIKARAEDVFQFLVEADKLEQWFYTECKISPDTGRFTFWFVSQVSKGKDLRSSGKIRILEPYERLVLDWNDGTYKTVVEFNLKRVTKRCTFISLLHKEWSEAGIHALFKQKNQWDFYLDNLKRVAEGQSDLRENFFGQVVKAIPPREVPLDEDD